VNSPRSKKAWKAVLAQFKLKSWAASEGGMWLDILPNGQEIDPVPFVQIPVGQLVSKRAELAEHGLHLAWSTLHLVDGYHHDKNVVVYALTRPSDDWWEERKKKGKI
jgi:hypothetical protein